MTTCGDGITAGTEQCDDGAMNVGVGDGCRAVACTVYPRVTLEMEPNDTQMTANDITTFSHVTGTLMTGQDLDSFRFTAPTTFHLTAEVLSTAGSCPGDLQLRLFSPDGTLLVLDDDDSPTGLCPLINPVRDAAARGLPPGTYALEVRHHDSTATAADYRLSISALPNVCGDRWRADAEACDDGNQADGDGCTRQCATVCGDGIRNGAEECDYISGTAPPGCNPLTCRTTCGDGLRAGIEQCDDMNSNDTDGCTSSCRLVEVEPNDTAAMARAYTFPAGTPVAGALVPNTDVDWFSVEVPEGGSVYAETNDGTPGSCSTGADTELTLIGPDETGPSVAHHDGPACSRIDPVTSSGARDLAAGTYFVQVNSAAALGTAPEIPAYSFSARVIGPVCGDGQLTRQEQCDDGNVRDGDGCTSNCMFQRLFTAESEDNGTPELADSLDPGTGGWLATMQSGTDVDWFTFTLSSPTPGAFFKVRLDTSDGLGGCAFDSLILLTRADGTTINADNDGRPGRCSLLAPELYPALGALPAGTYNVKVSWWNPSGPGGRYALSLTATEGVCGDGARQGAEECDDADQDDSDACSTNCLLTGSWQLEAEDNGTVALANAVDPAIQLGTRGAISPAMDVDIYRIEQPTNFALRARVMDGAGGCPFPSRIELLGAAGTVLTQGPEGFAPLQECGQLNPVTNPVLRNLAANTAYFLRVSHRLGGTADGYLLEITPTPTRCGDGLAQAPEDCDDGNGVSGDGCTPLCVREGTWLTEADESGGAINSTRATATMVTLNGIEGVIGTVRPFTSDEDWYAFDVPANSTVSLELSDGAGGCSFNSLLEFINPAGTLVASDNDDGPGYCAHLNPRLLRTGAASDSTGGGGDAALGNVTEAGVYFARLRNGVPTSVGARYFLRMAVAPVRCGDAVIQAPEQCDDGNALDADGCSSSCMYEPLNPEIEPNGACISTLAGPSNVCNPTELDASRAAATVATLRSGFQAAITTPGEDDWFAFTLTEPAAWVEIFLADPADPAACPDGADTYVELFGATGSTVLAADDQSGAGFCSAISGYAATCAGCSGGNHEGARNLAAGTYYIRARAYFGTDVIPSYAVYLNVWP